MAKRRKSYSKGSNYNSKGAKAQRAGKTTERKFKESLDILTLTNRVTYTKTGPPVLIQNSTVTIIGQGPPDWQISARFPLKLIGFDGSVAVPILLDTKHEGSAVNTTLLTRTHQFKDMYNLVSVGGIGGYMMEWGDDNWLYVPARHCTIVLTPNNKNYDEAVRINRADGIPCKILEHVNSPEFWLNVVLADYARYSNALGAMYSGEVV